MYVRTTKTKKAINFICFYSSAKPYTGRRRRRSAYNKFCNMPSTCGGQGVVYNGERWSCSGLDVVTEIYDCGEIGKKKEKKIERKASKKNSMCGNRSAAAAAAAYIHTHTHARPTRLLCKLPHTY